MSRFNITGIDAEDLDQSDDLSAGEYHMFPEADIQVHTESYLCHCIPQLLKTVYGQHLYHHRAFKDRRH